MRIFTMRIKIIAIELNPCNLKLFPTWHLVIVLKAHDSSSRLTTDSTLVHFREFKIALALLPLVTDTVSNKHCLNWIEYFSH